MNKQPTRRDFVQSTAVAASGLACLGLGAGAASATVSDKPAAVGGAPTHPGSWPEWPQWDEAWEPNILEVFRSGDWSTGGLTGPVGDFETTYANLLGAKGCVATASGTTALLTALHTIGIDAGDEVIVSPYTFIATYNAILAHKALPVFADTDPETLTLDPSSIESRITDRTRAIVPVHIFGMPCDMDPINQVARKHDLLVVEDACQAWLAEYKGRKCGTLGSLGCFSFQNSKHLPSGEGGAVTGMDQRLLDQARSYHDCGRAYGTYEGKGFFSRGLNYRLTHYQGMVLQQQIAKLVTDTEHRRQNAARLLAGLAEIPGIETIRLPRDSRAVWHLFPFRYNPEAFHGLTLVQFLRALRSEGIPCSEGYTEQYFDGLLDETISSRGFTRLYSAERLKAYRDSLDDLKGNRATCESTVTLSQRLLLGSQKDIEDIVEAIQRIQTHSNELV